MPGLLPTDTLIANSLLKIAGVANPYPEMSLAIPDPSIRSGAAMHLDYEIISRDTFYFTSRVKLSEWLLNSGA